MALPESESSNFMLEPAPRAEQASQVAGWAERSFQRLQEFFRRPAFPGVLFQVITSINQEEFKAQDGMMIYAAGGVLGPQPGFYVREGGTWKKLAGS